MSDEPTRYIEPLLTIECPCCTEVIYLHMHAVSKGRTVPIDVEEDR